MIYYSKITHINNGSVSSYAVPFPLLDPSHLVVEANGEAVEYSYITSGTISITPVIGKVTLKRVTPLDSRSIDFDNLAGITAESLDISNIQLFYACQELYDSFKFDDGNKVTLKDLQAILEMFNNYYTKAQVDALLDDVASGSQAEIQAVAAQLNSLASNVYTKAQTYSKSQIDTLVNDSHTELHNETVALGISIASLASQVYTKTQVDTLLADVYTKAQTYSKSEVDTLIEGAGGGTGGGSSGLANIVSMVSKRKTSGGIDVIGSSFWPVGNSTTLYKYELECTKSDGTKYLFWIDPNGTEALTGVTSANGEASTVVVDGTDLVASLEDYYASHPSTKDRLMVQSLSWGTWKGMRIAAPVWTVNIDLPRAPTEDSVGTDSAAIFTKAITAVVTASLESPVVPYILFKRYQYNL